MSASGRDLKRALGAVLTLYITKVRNRRGVGERA
jgi:hypothetical protein